MTDLPTSQDRLAAALPREHILMAYVRAQDRFADPVEAVEGSTDTAEAVQRVRTLLDLDEDQATAILDMQVRRMSAAGRARIRDELEQLRAEIKELRAGL